MPKPAQLSHVILRTYDVQALANWYRAALEGKAVIENPAMVFLTYDDEHHRIGFVQLPGEKPARRDSIGAGLDHFAFTISSVSEILDHYLYMKAAGNDPVLTVNHGPTVSFYYKDPDGNNVEFFVERFANPEEANAFIASPTFQANTMGIEVDPDEMVARRQAGATERELVEYDTEAPVDPAKIREMSSALA